jgi:hypothetical protein
VCGGVQGEGEGESQ